MWPCRLFTRAARSLIRGLTFEYAVAHSLRSGSVKDTTSPVSDGCGRPRRNLSRLPLGTTSRHRARSSPALALRVEERPRAPRPERPDRRGGALCGRAGVAAASRALRERGVQAPSCRYRTRAYVVPMHRIHFVEPRGASADRGRPTPELGDVRFNGEKQECATGARHHRRGAPMRGTQWRASRCCLL